jgi:hypothetical protein
MSGPDSEIISKILSDKNRAAYTKQLDDYHKTDSLLFNNLNRLKALDKEREQLTETIQQQKQDLDSYIVSISILLKNSLAVADYSKPRSPKYTDLHRMQKHNVDLNIEQVFKQDPVFEHKIWKSRAFYDTLCAQYPVFDDLGDNTFKKVSLTQAKIYWESKLNDANVICNDTAVRG